MRDHVRMFYEFSMWVMVAQEDGVRMPDPRSNVSPRVEDLDDNKALIT